MLKISKFIEFRNVEYDTIRRYISRNPEIFKGHTGRPGRIELDDYAVEQLEKKYPLPHPVQVVEDTSARKKLSDMQEKLIFVMEQNQKLIQENAELRMIQNNQTLLEDKLRIEEKLKDEAIDAYHDIFDRYERQADFIDELRKILNYDTQEKIKLQKALEQEKRKTWLDKLRGR